MSAIVRSIIRPSCVTEEHFTWELCRTLDLPQLHRMGGESERDYLIRRLEQLKWISRYWSQSCLELLSPELLEVAALQICNAAADYCQDRACERQMRGQA